MKKIIINISMFLFMVTTTVILGLWILHTLATQGGI